MKPINISLNDLLQELNIEDSESSVRELRKLLRKNRLPHIIGHDKLISSSDADKILMMLRGKRINWYKYKQQERDVAQGGPIHRRQFQNISEFLEKWYNELVGQESNIQMLSPIIGISDLRFL